MVLFESMVIHYIDHIAFSPTPSKMMLCHSQSSRPRLELMLFKKPFTIAKSGVFLGQRILGLAIWLWMEMLKTLIHFQTDLLSTFFKLPIRIFNAIRTQSTVEMRLHDMQLRHDNLLRENKKLQDELQVAIDDVRDSDMVITEVEDDYENSLSRIRMMESEVHALKSENLRLLQWRQMKMTTNKKDGTLDGIWSRAIVQSMFSAGLSVLVGVIIWGSEDPCMPLVTALFIVVGMSLTSVVQFFSVVKNKPGSDAFALLSLNWFILGALTSPTLARIFQSPAVTLSNRIFGAV